MSKGKIAIAVLIIVLLFLNLFLAAKYMTLRTEVKILRAEAEGKNFNSRVVDFIGLFIEKVLKSKQEVGFEDRLGLETAVRNLNDNQILEQWNKFINSKTESEAQEEVKNLLSLLVQKIRK